MCWTRIYGYYILTDAELEVLLRLPPPHLTIEKEASKATQSYLVNGIRVSEASQKALADEILNDTA